ncbi:CBS domain-containing protein [Sphingomonas sp. C3-2]|uniref:CBS domain-containing protein n=1 Tax=Sphingomonas sp. C3-2 TaxID=3062169 RepID=UPI00294AE51A|nr:CBS domain-containing protein [Sphingomonas sp. C3-2]WOK35977.1 CBS domain-containing protein [Sphingomonas sp. C3-2]
MRVREMMTADVRTIDAEETLQDAATLMAEIDAGILPVAHHEKLVGMITDRDIAIRGVARGRGADTLVQDVMSQEVKYCFDDDEVDLVLAHMAESQIRRLPVLDRDKRLVGVISIGDIALGGEPRRVGKVLGDIARPSALHSQS